MRAREKNKLSLIIGLHIHRYTGNGGNRKARWMETITPVARSAKEGERVWPNRRGSFPWSEG